MGVEGTRTAIKLVVILASPSNCLQYCVLKIKMDSTKMDYRHVQRVPSTREQAAKRATWRRQRELTARLFQTPNSRGQANTVKGHRLIRTAGGERDSTNRQVQLQPRAPADSGRIRLVDGNLTPGAPAVEERYTSFDHSGRRLIGGKFLKTRENLGCCLDECWENQFQGGQVEIELTDDDQPQDL
jgi:hypothetical protein